MEATRVQSRDVAGLVNLFGGDSVLGAQEGPKRGIDDVRPFFRTLADNGDRRTVGM